MAILFGGSGGTFIASLVSDQVYDPVYDTDMSAEFIWQILPDFYRNLMADKEIFSTMWSGTMQGESADLLNLWQIDYAKSLRTVPVLGQRKWILFDLYREIDFTVDPALTFRGVDGVFTYDEALGLVSGSTTSRARSDRASTSLRGVVSQDASLTWEVEVTVSSLDTHGSVLFGYFSSASGRLANALCVALLGSESGADSARPAIYHVDPSGIGTAATDSYVLTLDTQYRLSASYTANTGAVVLTTTEVRKEKLTGTGGVTQDDLGAAFTNQMTDPVVNFDTEGIVEGDILVAFGREYEILSVDGSLLTVSPIALPIDVDGFSYEILGEVEVSSVSMDLPADTLDPSFSCDEFGVNSLDIRSLTPVVFSSPANARLKKLSFTTDNWKFFDPTVSDLILSLPRLQDVVTDPQYLLYQGTDFEVQYETLSSTTDARSTILFQEPQPQELWAEYVAYDERYIRDNFGLNVGLDAVSTDQYKSRVRGLYYAYFQGPTVSAIELGVHLLVGLPIADPAGTVEAVNPAFSGTLGLITVEGNDYLYPSAVGTDLQVGDTVSLFQPLSRGVEVIDYVNDPDWFVSSLTFNEVQKFHTFQVRLNLDAFELETLDLAATFVENIKPTWKQVLFLVFKELVDEVEMTDTLSFGLTINLYDTPCDEFVIAYDDALYEGEEADWRYSQGVASPSGWDGTSAAMRGTSTLLDGYVNLTSGSTTASGSGTTFLADVVATDNLAVAIYREAATGETTASSHNFYDPAANFQAAGAEVQVGDQIDISGVGTFEILVVVDGQNLTLDAPMPSTATGVSYSTSGKLLFWDEVGSVTDDVTLDFVNTFPYATFTYKVAVLDPTFGEIFYDQFTETCPDEELSFVATLSPGYQETILTGQVSFASGSTAVAGVGTNFTGEIGGPGAVADKFIVMPDGAWVQVASVTDATNLVLASPSHADFSAVPTHLADEVLSGTFTASNGSPTVTASVSQTGVVGAGDYIQVVPVQDTANPVTGSPVVKVLSINGAGTTITLDSNYTGDSVVAVQMIRRGPAAVLPLAQDLPDAQTTVVTQNFTDWFGQSSGDSVSSTVAELVP